MYAKLENNQLIIAETNYYINEQLVTNFNKNTALLKHFGYKEVIDIEPPYDKDLQHLEIAEYKELEDSIQIIYTIVDNIVEVDPVKVLQDSQILQDDAILMGMMASAELTEMILPILESIMATMTLDKDVSKRARKTRSIREEVTSPMVDVYATLVLAGKYTVNESEAVNGVKLVPLAYREKVIARLADWAK